MHAVGAFDGDELIAVGFVCPDGDAGEWRVRGMATAPEYRGRGAGAAILELLVDHARANGATRVWCNARTPALSLYGTKKVVQQTGYSGYDPAVVAMCKFFKSHEPPVDRNETIEIYAFMEAADESKKQGGKPVALADIIERAEKESEATSKPAGGEK